MDGKRTEQFLNDPIFPLLIKMSAPNTVAFLINAVVCSLNFGLSVSLA